jgi:flagellar hook assembly protein FlgD
VRRLTAGILAGLIVLAGTWTAAPGPAAAASSDPKVVLVVGATHGTTSTYRSYMGAVATMAARYSRNVVKVYSPNATWSKVRAAMQGASIVVYMGHGNGFPSPYSTTLNRLTQNGMGLNLTAGDGDSNTKYYGEKYIEDEVTLAPNAVVILSHLCYASGNSEPGRAEPTLSVAKARMDNFAAGFLRAGARAVIAEGHGDPSFFVEQLFTTHRTIEQIWRSGPRPRGNVFSFASVRTPGYTVFSDPNERSGSSYSGFYRSLVTRLAPALTSDQVTGAGYARTDAHPGWFSVPGAAEVVASGGAGLYPDATFTPDPDTGQAPATLPAGTRLRLVAAAGTTPDGSPAYEVATLDGATTGFAGSGALAPRDGTPPRIWEIDPGAGALSPNGDGSGDTVTLAVRASEWATWVVSIAAADGAVVRTLGATGEQASVAWDGKAGGTAVADGSYTATVTARDAWGNAPARGTVRLVVDTVAPALDQVQVQAAAPPVFTPNGDGSGDAAVLRFGATEGGTVQGTVSNARNTVVATFSGAMATGAGSATWDGRSSNGAFVPDGEYSISLRPVDHAGNRGTSVATTVVAYGALGFVQTSRTAIHAKDGDRFAKSTTLSFRLLAPATVTWTLVNEAGAAVVTRYDATPLPAGSYSWSWNGKLPSGAYAPSGYYWSRVVATDGVTSVAQTAKLRANAFRLVLSDETPRRGQLITATIVSTEPLGRSPRLTVTQPGLAPVVYSTSRSSTYVYRVTFRLSSRGSSGALVLRVSGRDKDGGYNASRFVRAID